MTHPKILHNWLLILGLDFDPAPSNEKILMDAVEKKMKFSNMSDNRNNPTTGGYYTTIAEKLNKTENGTASVAKILLNPAKRDELSNDARRIVYKHLDKFITTAAEADGHEEGITSQKIVKIAQFTQKFVQKETGIPDWECSVDVVRKCTLARGLKIIETNQGYSDTTAKDEELKAYEPFSKKARWRTKDWNTLDNELRQVGVNTLYEYARIPKYESAPSNAPSEELLKQIESLRESKKEHNAEKSSADRIASYAREILKSKTSRAEYDEYLEFVSVNDRLEVLKDIVGLNGGPVGDDALNGAIREVTEVISDKSKAPLIVRGFCRKHNLKLILQTNSTYCRCGYANTTTNTFCQGCGLPLQVICPSCGKKIRNSYPRCACGQSIGDELHKANLLYESALAQLKRLNLEAAEALLKQANETWPNLPRASEIKQKIGTIKASVAPAIEELDHLMEQKEYSKAKQASDKFRRQYVEFDISSRDSKISEHLKKANNFIQKAMNTQSDNDKFNFYELALATCIDHQEALSFMQNKKPEAPSNFRSIIDSKTNLVKLKWDASPSKGYVNYTVRRYESVPSINPCEGKEISTGNLTATTDANVLPGKKYYYTVFAVRYGAFSSGLRLDTSICLINEVEDLVITPNDEAIQFHWKRPVGGRIEVTEEAPRHRTITRTTSNHFVHTGLNNGSTYTYRVQRVYQLEGEDLYSKGFIIAGTPIDPNDYIRDFRASRGRGSSPIFNFTWTTKTSTKTLLFETDDRGTVPEKGLTLTLDSVKQAFIMASVQNLKRGSASMLHGTDEPLYIFPVSVYGKTAVIGNYARICGKEEMRIIEVFRANDDLIIRINPAKEAVAFVVFCRSDRFVSENEQNRKDGDQFRQQIPLKTYERDGALKIKYAGSRNYFISVCAVYASPNTPTYSALSEYLFSSKPRTNITYSIRMMKIPFIGAKTILVFKANEDEFFLPKTVIEYGIGGLPVLPGSGTQVAVIPAQSVIGSLDFEVKNLPRKRGIYLKASPLNQTCEAYLLDSCSTCRIS